MPSQTTPNRPVDSQLIIRRGTAADRPALYHILIDAIWDLAWRIGIQDDGRIPTEEERAQDFPNWQPILEHFEATSDQFWVAEREGKPLGYARSILRDGVRELTEFFVATDAQTEGVGRELITRAMPPGARRNVIIATIDLRAQARYHKLGLFQVCAVYTFLRKPEAGEQPDLASGDLNFISITQDHLPQLAQLDLAIHGHRRDEDHAWLLKHRSGFLLQRHGYAVGYGYVGDPFSGPFVLLDDADFPIALIHAENLAAQQNREQFGLDVPMLNHAAVRHLLNRGYRMSPFFCFMMSDDHPAHIHKTIVTSPMVMV